jgi:hypothetical protein
MADVGISPDEVFDNGAVGDAKHQQRPVCRIGESTPEDEFATLVSRPGEPKMFLPELRPSRYIIANEVIEKRVVVHVSSFQITAV